MPSDYSLLLTSPSAIMAGKVSSSFQCIQRSNKGVLEKEVIFLPTLLFCSLGLHLLFKRQRQGRRGKYTYLDTHICTTASSHLFFLCLRQKHPSNQKADPFPSPCCPSFQCFSLLLLCEHMSVNIGWGFVVCCGKLPELVSEESK